MTAAPIAELEPRVDKEGRPGLSTPSGLPPGLDLRMAEGSDPGGLPAGRVSGQALAQDRHSILEGAHH